MTFAVLLCAPQLPSGSSVAWMRRSPCRVGGAPRPAARRAGRPVARLGPGRRAPPPRTPASSPLRLWGSSRSSLVHQVRCASHRAHPSVAHSVRGEPVGRKPTGVVRRSRTPGLAVIEHNIMAQVQRSRRAPSSITPASRTSIHASTLFWCFQPRCASSRRTQHARSRVNAGLYGRTVVSAS